MRFTLLTNFYVYNKVLLIIGTMFVQKISRPYSSCLTEILYLFNGKSLFPPPTAPRGPSPVVWHLSPRESPPQPEPPATLPRVLVSTPQMLGPGSVELLRSQRLLLTLSSPNVCPHLSFPFCALSHLLTRLPPLPRPSAAPAWPPPPAASVFLALGCAS